LPFDVTAYPCLSRIISEAYHGQIVYKHHIDGAHDRNWLKEYELFYNKQLNSTPYVRRVFFKYDEPKGKSIGFVDLRSATDGSEVSETYLSAPKPLSESNGAYLKCEGRYTEYGQDVRCTPYIMPDSIFGMCIHGSLWIAIKILENRRTVASAVTIPEIQTLARGHPYADKEGLYFKQAARLLRMSQTHAIYVQRASPDLDDDGMLLELYSYVESGLPVILGVDTQYLPWWAGASEHDYHSIVAIGHTMKDNVVDGFIFHDESALPYQTLKNGDLLNAWRIAIQNAVPDQEVRELLVAVPPEVTLQFTDAFNQFREMLELVQQKGIFQVNADGIRFRPVLLTAMELLFHYRDVNGRILRPFYECVTPATYLWVIFWYDEHDDRRSIATAKGFFVRDATRETNFRFIYFKQDKTGVYQSRDKIYQIWENRKSRKRL